ncbi:hypothetical protein BIY23_02555 [Wolbachia pipientis]|uniref:RDD domain-containing protein n=1 Tax=Wolbachia pipientis TaxID=955 RepID=A0A1E7QJT7_WOLPI|nr:RDD family protein [Wolbachia pipientis]OEY86740.1 hypothetical protein BIY23_02555 [Wolbachia pipientis]
MLYRFFQSLISIFFSVTSISNQKKNEKGICYVAGIRRYISILVDLIIIICILNIFSYMHNFFDNLIMNQEILIRTVEKYKLGLPLSEAETTTRNKVAIVSIFVKIFECIMLFSYILCTWLKFSATPGKLLFGLRVVDANTFKKITLKQAIKRFLALVALIVLSVVPIFIMLVLTQLYPDIKFIVAFLIVSVIPLPLNYIWASFDKQRQALHDKIAGTVVVTSNSLNNHIILGSPHHQS